VNRGTFETPCADPACATCSALRADCSYSHIPLAVVLGRSVEVFLDAPTSMDAAGDAAGAVPLRVLSEGDLFGVFETLHSLLGEGEARPPWSVSSGSRSIWIIAPLGDRRITEALTARCGCHVDWSRTEPFRKVENPLSRGCAGLEHEWPAPLGRPVLGNEDRRREHAVEHERVASAFVADLDCSQHAGASLAQNA